MARAKKKSSGGSSSSWMVTYADLMTLLLTFFVLLISMSQLDERSVRNFLVSTQKQSMITEDILNPISKENTKKQVHPGPISADELEFIREFIWENKKEDLNLQTNRNIAIISIGEDVLFNPGSASISSRGKLILDRLAPQIQKLQYPMLVAGHTSSLRDESTGSELRKQITTKDTYSLSPTWILSINRAIAVYEFFKIKNLAGIEIINEAFGEHQPKVSNNTLAGRKANRRVDLVLDRRNKTAIIPAPQKEEEEKKPDIYEFKNFKFQLGAAPTIFYKQAIPSSSASLHRMGVGEKANG